MTPRIIGPLLLMPLLLATVSSAFQLPTSRVAHLDAGSGRAIHARPVVMSLSRETEEDSPRLPFFARALKKLRPKKEDLENASLSDVVVLEERVDVDEERVVDSEADVLRALADKTRLEAQKMDILLTLRKIDKIEEKMSRLPILNESIEETNRAILSETQLLMRKFNAPKQVTNGDITLAHDEVFSSGNRSQSTTDSEQRGENNLVQKNMNGEKPLLSEDKRQDAIDAYEKLPEQIKNMMAKSVGLKDGTNATAAIEKLIEEDRLFQGEGDEQFSMVAKSDDFEEIFVDLDFAEINSFVNNMLPEVTRKEPVNEEYIDALYAEVLGKDTFNPRERKPQAIPGGYLIRGESKVRPVEGKDDGDVLIEALDKKISKSSVAGKIQVYYILDPTPPSGEEIMNEEDETPVLFITNNDISPDTKVWVKPAVTFLGLASIALFSLGSFSFNEEVLNRIAASSDAGDGSLDLLYDLSLPLALSLLVTQLSHEAGHLIIAAKDGIGIGLPTFVPSFQLGLTGTITPIETPPKNIKSLFDFAITGPILGILASTLLLYFGLEMTVFLDTGAQGQLPSVPAELLRSSALGGGIIDFLLGDGVLNSPDPSSDMIRLHPFAIAGFAGLMTNALSLLPIGNTDGGRISLTFFGRSFSRVVQGTAILVLVISGLFGGDKENILLLYALYCQTWQKEAEVPCRNEVDELDSVRGLIAIGISLIVILTLTPLP